MKNLRAASPMRGTGCAAARIVRRNSCSTSSLPAISSPRSRARSSSAISIARASGVRDCRYSRSRPMDGPSLVIGTPLHLNRTVNVLMARRLRRGYAKRQEFNAIDAVRAALRWVNSRCAPTIPFSAR